MDRIERAVVTDVDNNKVKVYVKSLNVVSDWINLEAQKIRLNIGDNTHECEYTPKYEIDDNVAVILKNNSYKGFYIIGKLTKIGGDN